ncbi:helix-turn-helix domain-containing protein [Hymenobacter cheonanensis]|uniref:helix-turn-helix domain-containing protein n=1 Tax=Hymenobacter sp. CA2-7 TaxID=3063993 RepID=UPI002713C869|nr:helix-turn-helix transcriptional regulator [Hymenobacter sp. CA2-7]MDO7886009.1 helix-turn-helix transcriptional regulator [Hymenobacter sp. CA2-7]
MSGKTPLGAKILSLRKGLGETQGSLGAKVGVSRAAISQFELGDSIPSAETRAKLSAALGFDLSTVWSTAADENESSDTFISLIFYSINDYAGLIDNPIDFVTINDDDSDGERLTSLERMPRNRVPVLRVAGMDYGSSFVIEIGSNNMGARYPSGARYVADVVPIDEVKYALGVHIFVWRRSLILRRIVSNQDGRILARVDATGEEISWEFHDIINEMAADRCQLFRLRQAVHLPAED